MKKRIRRYYFIQLLVGLLFYILILNLMGEINQIDDYAKAKLFVLSIIGCLMYTFFNGLIHLFNFSYLKKQSNFLAFYIPIFIWCIPFVVTMAETISSSNPKISDWLFNLIWIQPMLYNLLLKKAVVNSIRNQ